MDERHHAGLLDEGRRVESRVEAMTTEHVGQRRSRHRGGQAYRDIDVGGQPGGAVQKGGLGAEQVPRHAGLSKRVRGVGEKLNDR